MAGHAAARDSGSKIYDKTRPWKQQQVAQSWRARLPRSKWWLAGCTLCGVKRRTVEQGPSGRLTQYWLGASSACACWVVCQLGMEARPLQHARKSIPNEMNLYSGRGPDLDILFVQYQLGSYRRISFVFPPRPFPGLSLAQIDGYRWCVLRTPYGTPCPKPSLAYLISDICTGILHPSRANGLVV